MQTIRTCLLFLLLTYLPISIQAQNTVLGSIKGKVVDAITLQPLSYSTVILTNLKDTTRVIGTLVEKSIPNYQNLYLIASVGFLGAFTTFSTFGFETLNLIRFENLILALANVAANIIIGILAVYAGRNLANLF